MKKYRLLLLAAAGGGILTIVGSWDTKQAKADHLEVIEAWVAAWNSHNPDALTAVHTADAVYEDVPFGLVNNGTDQIRAFAQFFFTAVPDLKVEFLQGHLKGGHGTIEWVFSGTDVGVYKTGKKFSVRGASVIDVHGEKISRTSDYYALATILRELGLLPPGL
jgi:steroid delta-isomerase-like uncharacterized protein